MNIRFWYVIIIGTFVALGLVAGMSTPAMAQAVQSSSEYTLAGPYTHKNLEIFLIHGSDHKDRKPFLILGEAMEKEVLTVYETGSVQQLKVKNTSRTEDVFIHAGDIVKGGKQDRLLRHDLIVPAKSGKMSLDSFCVEARRWNQRGNEGTGSFAENEYMVSSKELKLASKYEMDQGRVWDSVAVQQGKLNSSLRNMSGKKELDVRASESGTSLQLTLENEDLEEAKTHYKEAINGQIGTQGKAIGFAFAINGQLNSADVYESSRLFQDLWPKLLDSAVVEAVSLYDSKEDWPAVESSALKEVLTGNVGQSTSKDINKYTRLVTYDTADFLLFETLDAREAGRIVHRNYIVKGKQERR